MEETALDTPFLTNGVAHVAFWNGRILTAEDLKDEQQANLLSRRRLGRTFGHGIASGLNVAAGPDTTQVNVGAGAAIDLLGQALELPVDVTVSLVVPPEPITGDGVFVVCSNQPSATPTGTGLYILTIRPAEDDQASAPGIAAFGNGAATECGPRYTVDGVAFRLVALDADGLALDAGHDESDRTVIATAGGAIPSPLLRNTLAHLLLDTQVWSDVLTNPFRVNIDTMPGALTTLRAGPLEDCEVPLAMIAWSAGGVSFIDGWSVRRPVASSIAQTTNELLGDSTLPLLARAAYAQFQDELELHRSASAITRANLRINDVARYLPAAGMVPVGQRAGRGFNAARFFDELIVRGPIPIAAEQTAALLDESFGHRPIDLDEGEVLHLYSVDSAVERGPSYIVFTTSRMEYLGEELRIDAVFPAGPVTPGQTIEIRGQGFGFSQGLTRIRFNSIRANPSTASSDTRLIVDVPTALAPPAAGLQVELEVTNGEEADSVPLTVVRADEPLTGFLHVDFEGVEPLILVPGRPATVSYRLRSALNETADVAVGFTTTPSGAADNARLVLTDSFDPTTGTTRMDPDDVIEIDIVFDEVPDLESFAIELVAQAETIIGDHSRLFTTNEEIDQPDLTIDLSISELLVEIVPPATIAGSRITMGRGAVASVSIDVEPEEAGSYFVRMEPTSITGQWGVILTGFLPTRSEPVPERELVFRTDGEAGQSVEITVANQSATAALSASFIVRRAGSTEEARRLTFTLVPQ